MEQNEIYEILGGLSIKSLKYGVRFGHSEKEAFSKLLCEYLNLTGSDSMYEIKKGIDLFLFLIHDSLHLEIEEANYKIHKDILKLKSGDLSVTWPKMLSEEKN